MYELTSYLRHAAQCEAAKRVIIIRHAHCLLAIDRACGDGVCRRHDDRVSAHRLLLEPVGYWRGAVGFLLFAIALRMMDSRA